MGPLTGTEVRTLRVKTGTSLQAMAHEIGYSADQLARLELNDTPLPDHIAAGVAKVVTRWMDQHLSTQ